MGRKQDQALVDRIAREMIERLGITMYLDHGEKQNFIHVGEDQEEIGRDMGWFYPRDLYDTEEVAAAVRAKVRNLRSSTLGQIACAGMGTEEAPRFTVTPIQDVHPAAVATSAGGRKAVEELAAVAIIAKMYDLLSKDMEPWVPDIDYLVDDCR